MKEIEVKILDVDAAATVRRLEALGARRDFDGEMHALYFDTPAREISARRDALRLRSEGGRTILTVKLHAQGEGMKVNEEIETEVADFDAARRILLGLGYEVWIEMRKHRVSFVTEALPGVHFVFDRYLGEHSYVPELLEVEAPEPELLRQAVRAAGYGMDRTVPWNAVQVFEHYRQSRSAGS